MPHGKVNLIKKKLNMIIGQQMVTAVFHKSEIKLAWKEQMKQLPVTGNTITTKRGENQSTAFSWK